MKKSLFLLLYFLPIFSCYDEIQDLEMAYFEDPSLELITILNTQTRWVAFENHIDFTLKSIFLDLPSEERTKIQSIIVYRNGEILETIPPTTVNYSNNTRANHGRFCYEFAFGRSSNNTVVVEPTSRRTNNLCFQF